MVKKLKPPYYAVIFTSKLKPNVQNEYAVMAKRMGELAAEQDGFLGIESARNEMGITISYWRDEASILQWKQHLEHQIAQKKGKTIWYDHFHVRIAKVEREYEKT